MKRATPSRKRPGWLVVIGGYDQVFVDQIKQLIPSRDREWSATMKAWVVHGRHAGTLEELGVVVPGTETE